MKKITVVLVFGVLILLGQAYGVVKGEIREVVIWNDGVQIYPSLGGSPVEIMAGDTLYFDVKVKNTGDEDLSAGIKLSFSARHFDSKYDSDTYTTDYWEYTVVGANPEIPGPLDTHISTTPIEVKNPEKSFQQIPWTGFETSPTAMAGPTDIYVTLWAGHKIPGPRTSYLDREVIRINVVRNDPVYCLSHTYSFSPGPRLPQTLTDHPYIQYTIKNCGDQDFLGSIYFYPTYTIPRYDDLSWDGINWGYSNRELKNVRINVGESLTRRAYYSKDTPAFSRACITLYGQVYAKWDSDPTKLFMFNAPNPVFSGKDGFLTWGCPGGYNVWVTNAEIYPNKAVYKGGETMDYTYGFVLGSSSSTLTKPAYVKITIDIDGDGKDTIPVVTDYIDLDELMGPDGSMKASEGLTVTGSYSVPSSLAYAYEFILEGVMYRDPDGIKGNADDKFITNSEADYDPYRDSKEPKCVPEKIELANRLGGGDVVEQVCEMKNLNGGLEGIVIKTTPRLFYYYDVKNVNCKGFSTTPVVEVKSGTKGILVEAEPGCQFRIHYTPAVASMTPDVTPSVLLLFLAAALAAFVEARLRRMRLEKEGKRPKKAKVSKKKAAGKRKKT